MIIQMSRKRSFEYISIHAKDKTWKFFNENLLFPPVKRINFLRSPLFVFQNYVFASDPILVVINDTSLTRPLFNKGVVMVT